MPKRAKTVDSRGRLTLGPQYAGREVIVRERDDKSLVVEMARTIPEREAWLYDNPEALTSVRRGLDQVAHEDYSPGPDLDASGALAEQCADEYVDE